MVSNSDLRIQDDVEKTARGKWGNGCKWMRGKVESFLKIVVNGFWGPIGFGNGMVKAMAPIRITEAELARDTHGVPAKVREGVEVIVEQDHRGVAIMRTPQRSGRRISEILREAKERNSTVTRDSDFPPEPTWGRLLPRTSSHGTRRPRSSAQFQRSDYR